MESAKVAVRSTQRQTSIGGSFEAPGGKNRRIARLALLLGALKTQRLLTARGMALNLARGYRRITF